MKKVKKGFAYIATNIQFEGGEGVKAGTLVNVIGGRVNKANVYIQFTLDNRIVTKYISKLLLREVSPEERHLSELLDGWIYYEEKRNGS